MEGGGHVTDYACERRCMLQTDCETRPEIFTPEGSKGPASCDARVVKRAQTNSNMGWNETI